MRNRILHHLTLMTGSVVLGLWISGCDFAKSCAKNDVKCNAEASSAAIPTLESLQLVTSNIDRSQSSDSNQVYVTWTMDGKDTRRDSRVRSEETGELNGFFGDHHYGTGKKTQQMFWAVTETKVMVKNEGASTVRLVFEPNGIDRIMRPGDEIEVTLNSTAPYLPTPDYTSAAAIDENSAVFTFTQM